MGNRLSVAVMQTETNICRLCLESVTNYICADCLLADVQDWLIRSDRAELLPAILKLHEEIKRMLDTDENSASCMVCKNQITATACPCCYLFEIYSSLHSIDARLAQHFEKHFNFDFRYHHSYSQLGLRQGLHRTSVAGKDFQPVVIVDKRRKHDINMCDLCDQPADDLIEENGLWICETCIEA